MEPDEKISRILDGLYALEETSVIHEQITNQITNVAKLYICNNYDLGYEAESKEDEFLDFLDETVGYSLSEWVDNLDEIAHENVYSVLQQAASISLSESSYLDEDELLSRIEV